MVTDEEQFAAFNRLAELYCACLEDLPSDSHGALRAIRDSLLRLYTAAIHLPPVKSTGIEEWTGDFNATLSNQRWTIVAKIQAIGVQDSYRLTFHPLRADEGAMTQTMSDDLADIWRDMKSGLLRLQAEPGQEPSVYWEWRFGFQTHWGRHAIQALRILHEHLQDME